MASNVLKKITSEAKRIRKAHPTMKWISAVKQAGAKYRSGKKIGKAPKKRKPASRKPVKRSVRTTVRKTQTVKIGSVGLTTSQLMSRAAAQIKEQIGWYSAALFSAKTKKAKRTIQKKITALKAQYRKVTS